MTGTVLITGGAARIGRYIAIALAEDGWTVIIHYNRSEAKAVALAEDIKKAGNTAFTVGANLAVPSERDTLIERASALTNGPITALINNASTFDNDHAKSFSREEYDHHMDINLYAALSLSRDFARQLPKEQAGSIINMIDQRVYAPTPDYFTYAISKSALFAATKTMAQSYAPDIRVNGIGPGPTIQNKAQTPEEFETERLSTLLGDGSPPETIVDGVRYLLNARAVTGQMIAIDGGQHLI